MVSRQALGELAEDIIRTRAASGSGRPRPPPGAARQPDAAQADLGRRLGAGGRGGRGGGRHRLRPGSPAPGGRKTAENATSGSSQRPAPAASTTLTAWTVAENPDGTLKVTIREMEDPSGLQATLRADGARVVVTASLAWPAACGEWRGGDYRMGDQVVQTENRTGLPSADGTEFLIRPSAIPAGALLWVGLSQTGKPNGVSGPPGPMSFGYLTAGQACARS